MDESWQSDFNLIYLFHFIKNLLWGSLSQIRTWSIVPFSHYISKKQMSIVPYQSSQHLEWVCNKTGRDFSTMVHIYLLVISFCWWGPTPQNVTFCPFSLSSSLNLADLNTAFSAQKDFILIPLLLLLFPKISWLG